MSKTSKQITKELRSKRNRKKKEKELEKDFKGSSAQPAKQIIITRKYLQKRKKNGEQHHKPIGAAEK